MRPLHRYKEGEKKKSFKIISNIFFKYFCFKYIYLTESWRIFNSNRYEGKTPHRGFF